MKFKAVLFDMDGVLVNSERIMMKSAVQALRQWGVNAEPEDFVPFIGAGERAYLGGAASKYGVEYDPRMSSAACEVYGRLIEEESIAFDHAADTVRRLRAEGVKTAVCTSAQRDKLRYNLRALGLTGDDFDAVVTAEMIVNNKPSPDVFLRGAELLHTEPCDCLVVEDAKNGIRAAKAAGMHNAAVTTSFSARELVRDVDPEYIIPTVAELFSIM